MLIPALQWGAAWASEHTAHAGGAVGDGAVRVRGREREPQGCQQPSQPLVRVLGLWSDAFSIAQVSSAYSPLDEASKASTDPPAEPSLPCAFLRRFQVPELLSLDKFSYCYQDMHVTLPLLPVPSLCIACTSTQAF